MKKIVSSFLLIIIMQQLAAQQVKPHYFTHYGVKNGLAAYNTRSVTQDETGFIWIGTINGLQRFDGSRFITFRYDPSNINSIPDNYVDQLLFDKSNNLWLVLSDGSVGTFDTKRFIFRKARVKLTNENNLQLLRRLSEDSKGNIIFTYFNLEILTYNRQTNEFAAANNPFPIPANRKPVWVIDDPLTKKYWIGTDSGMIVYNTVSKNSSYSDHNIEHEPIIDKWGKLGGIGFYKIDSKRRLWFLSWPITAGGPGFYCWDMKNNVPILDKYNMNDVARNYIEPDFFLEQKDGSIWISGLKVMVKFSEERQIFIPIFSEDKEQSINYDRAYLFEDRENNIWVATSNSGVYVFNPSQQFFTSHKHINRESGVQGGGYLLSFLKARNGSILAGVWGDGPYRYDSSFNVLPLDMENFGQISGTSIWDICRINDGRTLWMVGQGAIVYVYDEITKIVKRYYPQIFEAKTIRQAVEDKQGNIWLGTQSRGVYRWMPSKAVNNFEDGFSRYDAIPNVQVKHMLLDHKGFLWVCTNKEGVYKIDPATGKIIEQLTNRSAPNKRLLSYNASVAFEYNDSIIIIATGGLNIYNTNKNIIEHITSVNGLPSDAVLSIEKDRSGYLWLGLMNGLCRMSLAKRSFTLFDRGDGMSNDNFQVAASYTLPDGRMLFGTSDDFVVFDPDNAKTNSRPPDVNITDFKMLNKSLLIDSLVKLKKIELLADENSISIGFAALSYFNKNKMVYYYMLEGIDKEWKKSNELNQAVYNYVPSGSYTFKVRAENADGVSSKNITELKIKVYPPFWKSWWFISLMVVLCSVLLYWIDRLQIKRKEGIHKMRSEIAGNLHEEVNLALNNINILSEMARIKADSEPAKSKEYIEQIHARSHNMIIAMDDMLWSLSPENDSMQKTIERMNEYIDALENRHGVSIEISVDKKVGSQLLNMRLRHEAFLLFKEGISNLIQAGTRNCIIHIGLEKNNLQYSMQFDNAHCDMQQLDNLLQRQDLEKHIQSINATLDVRVHKTNSVFVIRIPVGTA